jgi:orotidine-5'-phosphate decarboxylase
MNAYNKYSLAVKTNSSFLCVGLDTVLEKIPNHLREKELDGILEFNREIIESTKDSVCSFKINLAFYEQYGSDGFSLIRDTIKMIPDNIFIISDAKRGDIGYTSKAYAKACFEDLKADAMTVNPYMGYDSIEPFLENKEKYIFILALTSNPGSNDFQRLVSGGKEIYKHVIDKSITWAGKENLGFVVGATHPKELADIRNIIPERMLLIPGVGAQGGNVEDVIHSNGKAPFMINVSRDILYCSNDYDFAEKSAQKAKHYKELFNNYYQCLK